MRHPKITGLAVIAVFATSAAFASAAQAAPLGHVESAPVIVRGEQTVQQALVTNAGTVICNVAKLAGTVSEKTFSALTLSPEYRECTAAGLTAEVKTHGCKYVFHILEGSSPPAAKFDVSCEPGQVIEIVGWSGGCVITIGPQAGLQGIVFESKGSGTTRDVDASIAIKGITYSQSGLLCVGGTRTFTSGEYRGGTTLRAYNDLSGKQGAQEGMWIE